MTRCDVCGERACGRVQSPELRMILCGVCDHKLVKWLADGGQPQEFPPLVEARRRAVVLSAGVAARDRIRDQRANAPGPPVSQAVREQARHGIATIRTRGAGPGVL